MRRPSPALLVALAALVVSLSGAAVAAIPARDGDVHICYSQTTGKVRAIDTQRDSFDCPRNWDGFTIDSEPTQLVSPNGNFRAVVSNTSARVFGPTGEVEITPSRINVDAAVIEIDGSGVLDLRGGQVRINGIPQTGD
jgi:hypothetical protein